VQPLKCVSPIEDFTNGKYELDLTELAMRMLKKVKSRIGTGSLLHLLDKQQVDKRKGQELLQCRTIIPNPGYTDIEGESQVWKVTEFVWVQEEPEIWGMASYICRKFHNDKVINLNVISRNVKVVAQLLGFLPNSMPLSKAWHTVESIEAPAGFAKED